MRKHVLFALSTFMAYSNAWACEPCAKIWDMDQTAKNADVIIIGKRITPKATGEDRHMGPDIVEIKVDLVLKGTLQEEAIQAHAWSGMCTYGIVTEPQESFVIFLQKTEEGIYDSVNYGCALKVLPVDNGQVIMDDRSVDIQQFKQLLNDGSD